MAGETLITITDDERERLRLMSEEKAILDKQSVEVHARRKGRAEGRLDERQHFLELLEAGLSVEEIKQRLISSDNQGN